MKPLILASASPRRADLLRQIGLEFAVKKADIDETLDALRPLPEQLLELAMRKAWAAAEKRDCLILAADTVVLCDERIMGKPASSEEAREMLCRLSGCCHQVTTAVALLDLPAGRSCQALETTTVWFRELEPEEIESYLASGEPLDKAGAYGIQGWGAVFVKKIEGCYFNVVGLPLHRVGSMLRVLGHPVPDWWKAAGSNG